MGKLCDIRISMEKKRNYLPGTGVEPVPPLRRGDFKSPVSTIPPPWQHLHFSNNRWSGQEALKNIWKSETEPGFSVLLLNLG